MYCSCHQACHSMSFNVYSRYLNVIQCISMSFNVLRHHSMYICHYSMFMQCLLIEIQCNPLNFNVTSFFKVSYQSLDFTRSPNSCTSSLAIVKSLLSFLYIYYIPYSKPTSFLASRVVSGDALTSRSCILTHLSYTIMACFPGYSEHHPSTRNYHIYRNIDPCTTQPPIKYQHIFVHQQVHIRYV